MYSIEYNSKKKLNRGVPHFLAPLIMERTVHLWSKAYAPNPDTDPFGIQVDRKLWEELIREEIGQRVFLRIQNPGDFQDWIAPLGEPVRPEDNDIIPDEEEETEEHQRDRIPNIYLPLWMIDAGHFEGLGEPLQVTFLGNDAFPEATRLVFRVVDSAFYNSDVKLELEKALTSIGVIQKNTSLQIPIEALGGYQVEVFVAESEPADVVLCEGDEVAVEFLEPVDHFTPPPPQRPPTPIPDVIPTILPPGNQSSFESLLPPAAPPRRESFHPTGVAAFAGEGRTLGSDPSIAPPPWRQGIPRRRPPIGPRDPPLI